MQVSPKRGHVHRAEGQRGVEQDSDIHGLFQKGEGNASYARELPGTRLFVPPPASPLAFFLNYNTQVLFSAQTLKKTYYTASRLLVVASFWTLQIRRNFEDG